MYDIIFEADTKSGRWFDIILLYLITASVLVVMLESVESIRADWGFYFTWIEWTFTIVFTIEYVLRILCIPKPIKYIFSFYGLIDLLSIIPTYLGLFIAGSQSLSVIRSIRLLRVFRILKLGRFLKEVTIIRNALIASRAKIIVFLFAVLMVTVVLGTLMYFVESKEAGFTSIPRSIYWTIVTLTTVGYGDIAPQTVLGQAIASFIMIIGYGIIAVPTGIVSAEVVSGANTNRVNNAACSNCLTEDHRAGAKHCYKCGSAL